MKKRLLKDSILSTYKKIFSNTLFILVFILPSVSVLAGGDELNLEVDLKLKNEKVPCGTVPNFFLSIKNSSNKTIRILNIERGKFQHVATTLEVLYYDSMRDVGEDIGRMPSHFGEVSDNDYKELKIGSSVQFELGMSTMFLDYLPPGKYMTYIKYRPDPFSAIEKTIYESSKIIFEVIDNQKCKDFRELAIVR